MLALAGVTGVSSDGEGLVPSVSDDGTRVACFESLLFGRNFGLVTDVSTGPDGHLYVVSITHGAVCEISGVAERGGPASGPRIWTSTGPMVSTRLRGSEAHLPDAASERARVQGVGGRVQPEVEHRCER